jgi:hypothetical protein
MIHDGWTNTTAVQYTVQVPGPVLLQVENSVLIQGSGLVCPNPLVYWITWYPITIPCYPVQSSG